MGKATKIVMWSFDMPCKIENGRVVCSGGKLNSKIYSTFKKKEFVGPSEKGVLYQSFLKEEKKY